MYRLNAHSSDGGTEILTVTEDGVNSKADIAMDTITSKGSNGYSITNKLYQKENGSNILDLTNADSTAKDNLNRQRYTSKDESKENDVPLMPKKSNLHSVCSKVSVTFGVFFIIGCYLLPIILKFINSKESNVETNLEFSSETNTSAAKVCYMQTK